MSNNNTTISMTEHLSALLDDEAGDFEQRRVLDELKSSKKLCNKLSSYALIGETMRSGTMEKQALNAGPSFLAGIHEQITAEDKYHHVELEDKKTENQESKSWLRPVGGFALAASVAAIAVLGVQNYQLSKGSDVLLSTNQKSQNDLIAKNETPSISKQAIASNITENTDAEIAVSSKEILIDSDQYSQADSQTRSMLKSYVDSHMQYASNTTFVPSVRVIAYADYK